MCRASCSNTPITLDGLAIACHGRRVLVRDSSGGRHPCTLFGRRLEVVCGDRVRWQPTRAQGADGIIVAVEPRSTSLARIDSRGRPEVVAANLTLIVALVAPLPAPDFFTCDGYLAAARWSALDAIVVLNKCDLDAADDGEICGELEVYRALGYPIHRCARTAPESTLALAAALVDRTAVLVGQSGVGKSSLINRLVPGKPALEGELSATAEAGRHTTTVATLYALPDGGAIIDSPGVRGFAPPLPEPRWVATGFVEIERAASGCRFADCLHDNTAGCAVEEAAQAGLIHRRRLLSYRRLLALARRFDAERRSCGRPPRPRPLRK